MIYERYSAFATVVIVVLGVLLSWSWCAQWLKRKRGHGVIEVFKIPIPKDKLKAMPEKERSLLLLLGYAANQISFFAKLVILSSNKDGEKEMEQMLSGTQTQMSLRILVGVLNETWELVRKRFTGSEIGRNYRQRLDAAGDAALERLNKIAGPKGLFSDLRNFWIFHYPDGVDDARTASGSTKSRAKMVVVRATV